MQTQKFHLIDSDLLPNPVEKYLKKGYLKVNESFHPFPYRLFYGEGEFKKTTYNNFKLYFEEREFSTMLTRIIHEKFMCFDENPKQVFMLLHFLKRELPQSESILMLESFLMHKGWQWAQGNERLGIIVDRLRIHDWIDQIDVEHMASLIAHFFRQRIIKLRPDLQVQNTNSIGLLAVYLAQKQLRISNGNLRNQCQIKPKDINDWQILALIWNEII